jgi:transcriptional regulator with XRE-family HTH domain
MSFAIQLSKLRKKVGLTQQSVASQTGMSLSQIKNYESGRSQPTLDAIKKLSVLFSVSSDYFIFDEGEREPVNSQLQENWSVIARLDEKDQEAISSLLDAVDSRNSGRPHSGNSGRCSPPSGLLW